MTPRKDEDAWKFTQCWQRGWFAKPLGLRKKVSRVGTCNFRPLIIIKKIRAVLRSKEKTALIDNVNLSETKDRARVSIER